MASGRTDPPDDPFDLEDPRVPFVFAFDHHHDRPREEVILLLGGKAASLGVMAVDLGLPVPPAFTISTVACKAYLASGWPDGLDEELRAHMARLEALVGRRFGDAGDPLLVSVRSGAPRSMPGMMDTVLNLGLNDGCEAGLARASGDPMFAHDCHLRFVATYRDIVGVASVPADPWDQLRGAVEAVFRSWNSDRARSYRDREGISEALGTGVTVQAMVFGNRGADSGTGVLFTRNPATGERALYGDVLLNAQGEDVVAGTHATMEIARLDALMPAVAAELRRDADVLERHFRDCCDIEFTIERGQLWLLQTRVGKRTPRAALRMAVEMARDDAFPLTREEAVRRVADLLVDPPMIEADRTTTEPPLARGLGASPGLVAGEIRLSAEDAVAAADRGAAVILVRAETSPDDVHGMGRSCGILTSTGGFASHAAVVARGWGIPAVVGASAVVVGAGDVAIGPRTLPAGAVITIDGSTGEVFEGAVVGETRVAPEAEVLLDWARGLGIAVGGGPVVGADAAVTAPMGEQPPDDTAAEGVDPDEATRILAVKGYASPDAIATACRISGESATTVVDRLVASGLAEAAVGSYRLTPAGREAAVRLLAVDTATWGLDRATAALDAFLALDRRMKRIVTAWQTRGSDAGPVANDHADAVYDQAVLGDLAALQGDAAAWLAGLDGAPRRMAAYGERLGLAALRAAAGQGRYVASPRVDSYHGVWFELHEDLILLAGRQRADEVAAGRA